jgi:hypothetical protein
MLRILLFSSRSCSETSVSEQLYYNKLECPHGLIFPGLQVINKKIIILTENQRKCKKNRFFIAAM